MFGESEKSVKLRIRKMKNEAPKNGLAQILATSGLIQAQSLEILFINLEDPPKDREDLLKLGAIFEDIGNIYLNVSEQISLAYAKVDDLTPDLAEISSLA